MATTTTNFGWDIPQSTDLVKDGATAIAALGQDIDTAFVDFKGGTTGQVLKKTSGTDLDVEWGTASSGLTLINTTSFSGVSSVSLPAATFTSTYDNYRVVINIETSSSGTTSTLRMRASGSDNSSSNYAYTMHFLDTSATTYTQSNANTTTNWRIGFSDNGPDLAIIDISNPMKALRTGYQSVFNGRTTTHYTAERCAGQMTVTTAYDSLTYFQNGMTGTIKVYGYNQ